MNKKIKIKALSFLTTMLISCVAFAQDTAKVEEQVKAEEKEACIQVIMKELECNTYEAEIIYNDLVLAEVKETVDKMVAAGLLYVSGHNEDGEPLFQLTELRTAVRNDLGDAR